MQESSFKNEKYYVSVTSLVLTNALVTPKFMFYTIPAFRAALTTPGNLYSNLTSYKSLKVTITVWEDKEKMRNYYRGNAHASAMKQLKSISSYSKFHGYFTDEMPSDSTAIQMLLKYGRRVHGDPNPDYGDE